MNRVDAIAFDLDGTLVDSAGGIAHALNVALRHEGLPTFPLDTVRPWIGDGPDALIARALALTDAGSRDGLADRLRLGFDAATLAAPMAGSYVFAGIAATVEELAARRPLVVVTNKPTPLARAVLGDAGLLCHFASVHGADTLAQRKPSPLLLLQAAAGLGIAPEHLLMVGDAPPDIGAAVAAGSLVAWAGWGYGSVPAEPPERVLRLATPQQLVLQLALRACAPG